jgi:16S rRNA (cytosine1402-N4)-methyltransferase
MADTTFSHDPVMVDEVVSVFAPAPPGTVIDATLGGGGHSEALLQRCDHLGVVGLDRDADAIAAAAARLARFGDRARAVHVRFDALAEVVDSLALAPVSGVLFDLGVSSPQLDRAERGFSHRADAPLDMRMDRRQATTAADLVNTTDERDLANLLRRFGDEPHAARIARAVARRRAAHPIRTTGDLVEVIKSAVPAPARRRGGHPATRTFQALRIAVNDELDVLPTALDAALDLAAQGGRVAVLSYHSGEDRIAKERFRHAETGGCTCPPRLPCRCGATPRARLLWRGARKPSPRELTANPRSASARFRAVEVL